MVEIELYKVIIEIKEYETITLEKVRINDILTMSKLPFQAVKLNENNNWTYTWNQIEKSDKYSVKEINVPKGYKVTYSNEEYVFTVTNTDTLANTGQFYYSIIILTIYKESHLVYLLLLF